MRTINTMRGLLVGGAVLAAFVAALFGQWSVVVVLAVGIAAHAGLWVYLARTGGIASAPPSKPPSAGAPPLG